MCLSSQKGENRSAQSRGRVSAQDAPGPREAPDLVFLLRYNNSHRAEYRIGWSADTVFYS